MKKKQAIFSFHCSLRLKQSQSGMEKKETLKVSGVFDCLTQSFVITTTTSRGRHFLPLKEPLYLDFPAPPRLCVRVQDVAYTSNIYLRVSDGET